jgi:hypothetical protein
MFSQDRRCILRKHEKNEYKKSHLLIIIGISMKLSLKFRIKIMIAERCAAAKRNTTALEFSMTNRLSRNILAIGQATVEKRIAAALPSWGDL